MNKLPVLLYIVIAIITLSTARTVQGQVLDCVCNSQFAAGDRVIALVDDPDWGWNLPAGSIGTVVCGFDWAGGDEVWIRWDNYSDGVSVADCECEEADDVKDNSYWGAFCNEIELHPLIECACSAQYSVGDRVVALVNQPSNAQNVLMGTGGTVLCGDGLSPGLLISWDNWSQGGGLSDICTCQYVEDDNSQWPVGCLEVAPPTSPYTVDDDNPADFTTIQAAVDYAQDGESIHVYPGVYTAQGTGPVVHINGKSLVLQSMGDPWDNDPLNSVRIDGEGVRRCLVVENATAGDITTVISGFNLDNGNEASTSGGCMVLHEAGDVQVDQVRFSNCFAQGPGGGIYAVANTAHTETNIDLCTFEFCNSMAMGGGLYLGGNSGCTATISNSNMTVCGAGSDGGCLYILDDSLAELDNVTLQSGSAGSNGGGIYAEGALSIDASFIDQCEAVDAGGGLYVEGSSSVIIQDMTEFKSCTATSGGGAMFLSGQSNTEIHSSLFRYNSSPAGGAIAIWGEAGLMVRNTPGQADTTFLQNHAFDGNFGGGVFINSNGNVSFAGTLFSFNNADGGEGGGIYSENTALDLTNCTFISNRAGVGGGVSCQFGTPNIDQCTFDSNRATDYAAGLHLCFTDNATINTCIFDGNEAPIGAGTYNCSPNCTTATNCQFLNNVADVEGGGLYLTNADSGCNTVYDSCLFSSNSAPRGGGVVIADGAGTLTNSNFTGNSSTDGLLGGGGALLLTNTNATVGDCNITNNMAVYAGGGLFSENSMAQLYNCEFNQNSAKYGGGVYTLRSNAGPGSTFTACTFATNTGSSSGGGMMNELCGPNLIDCVFEYNTADTGAGMYNLSANPNISNTEIQTNTAKSGGAMYNQNSNPYITNSMIHHNGALYWQEPDTGRGGAICNEASNCYLENSTISENDATWGGGICNLSGSTCNILNCTFSDNLGKISGGGVYSSLSFAWLQNAFFCGNVPTHVVGAWDDAGGNTFQDVCPDEPGACVGDTNDDYNVDVLDLLYILAVWGTDNPAGDINDDGIVDVNDILDLINNWGDCI